MSVVREIPTHCRKGHPAHWCDCRKFVAAPNGKFPVEPDVICLTELQSIARADPMSGGDTSDMVDL